MRFTQGLIRAVQQHAQGTSTICAGRVRTYAQTADRVARLAGGLRALGLGRGARVAALSFNSDHLLETYLAIAWAGAVLVPVNFRWSVGEIAFSLNEAECSALIVGPDHLGFVDELRGRCPGLKQIIVLGRDDNEDGLLGAEGLIAQSRPVPDAGLGGDALLGIFYTGGTTGSPKGVMLSHGSLGSSALAMMAEGYFQPGGCGLHTMPMFHLGGLILSTCLVLRANTQVILPQFRADAVLDDIETHRVTDTMLVPSMMQMIVDAPGIAGRNLSSLRRISYGASPASESLIERVIRTFPNVELTQGYGMTETAAFISILPWSEHIGTDGKPKRLRSAGRGTYHLNVRISDGAGGEAERGQVGEILVRGPNVMIGYLKRPETTAEALRDGWLHTGDMGYMDADGYIYIVDRAKDMIISGGENVYSSEVENAIASHPAVQVCAVFGIPSEQLGESVHAAVMLREGQALTIEDLQAHCRPIIAGYKLPRSLEIVDALPLSGAGKVLKAELRERYWKGRERKIG